MITKQELKSLRLSLKPTTQELAVRGKKANKNSGLTRKEMAKRIGIGETKLFAFESETKSGRNITANLQLKLIEKGLINP